MRNKGVAGGKVEKDKGETSRGRRSRRTVPLGIQKKKRRRKKSFGNVCGGNNKEGEICPDLAATV